MLEKMKTILILDDSNVVTSEYPLIDIRSNFSPEDAQQNATIEPVAKLKQL